MSTQNDLQTDEGMFVNIPMKLARSLQKELEIEKTDICTYVTLLIEKAIADRIAESNSKIFTQAETKELEDDLKGLGYI